MDGDFLDINNTGDEFSFREIVYEDNERNDDEDDAYEFHPTSMDGNIRLHEDLVNSYNRSAEESEGESDEDYESNFCVLEIDRDLIVSYNSYIGNPSICHRQHRNAIISKNGKLYFQEKHRIVELDPKTNSEIILLEVKSRSIIAFAVSCDLKYLGCSLYCNDERETGIFMVKNLLSDKVYTTEVYKGGYRVNSMLIIGNMIHCVGQSKYYVVYKINDDTENVIPVRDYFLGMELGNLTRKQGTFGNFLAVSNNGSYLITSTDHFGITVFRKMNPSDELFEIDHFDGYTPKACDFVHFNCDDSYVAVAAQSSVNIYSVKKKFIPFKTLELEFGKCSICKFHRTNRHILAFTGYGKSDEPKYSYFYIFNLKKNSYILKIRFDSFTRGFSFFSPIGESIFVGTDDRKLREFKFHISVYKDKQREYNFTKRVKIERTAYLKSLFQSLTSQIIQFDLFRNIMKISSSIRIFLIN